MSLTDTSTGRRRSLIAIGALVLLLAPLGYGVAAYLVPAESGEPFLELPDPKHESCIEDTTYMRYFHMYLIKEIRDAGVRGGAIRKTSLASCRECHTSRERFCTRCHELVNMSPDCFECHYYP